MKPNLQFDFIADKQNHTLTIKREFNAKRQLVWDCYTKSELLERWFAPKPYAAKTKSMDFREGGHWHYAMVAPDGTEHWGFTRFITIQPIESYTSKDGFSDEDGNINKDLPQAEWDVRFIDRDDRALVHTIIAYKSLADLETVIQMGMKEGLTATHESLDKLLESLS